MASIEQRGRKYRITFRFEGVKYSRAIDAPNERAAERTVALLERNLELIKERLLAVPPGVDLVQFLLSDGRVAAPVANGAAHPNPTTLTLTKLFAVYFEALPEGNLEASTIQSMRIHQRFLERHFGKAFLIAELSTSDLQGYIAKRSQDKGRHGRKVTPVTIKKAIVTLRTIWNWARQNDLIARPYPSRGLRYPKGKEKPPFLTFGEAVRRTENMPAADAADWWESVFLDLDELGELLEVVKTNARQDFIYPLFVFAAHTGARRSEMLRSKLDDLDFRSGIVTLHERKKAHDKRTTRQVPMSPLLRTTLKDWLTLHPGGNFTFAQPVDNPMSRKHRIAPMPLSKDEIHDHFRRTLQGTKWEKLRGWHVFRHSFCSNCAAKGIDQRVINAWVGHLSDDMVRRYRHLLPEQRQNAITAVFGSAQGLNTELSP